MAELLAELQHPKRGQSDITASRSFHAYVATPSLIASISYVSLSTSRGNFSVEPGVILEHYLGTAKKLKKKTTKAKVLRKDQS